MTIKYLVFGGGATAGFAMYGSFKYLCNKNIINIQNIRDIYATSVGTMLAVAISLNHSYDILDDYLIKRPWEKITKITHEKFLNIGNEKGLFGDELIEEIIGPLITSAGLDLSITLLEFYNYNKICIHFFTIDINNIPSTTSDINYKNHPDIPLITAIRMSSAIPMIFKPVCIENKCYIDGGLILNFPLDVCLNETKCDESEVFAFKNIVARSSKEILKNTNIFDYIAQIFYTFENLLDSTSMQKNIKNIIINKSIYNTFNLSSWHDILSNSEIRENMINYGMECSEKFLKDSDLKTEE